jgi:hypothetical protein
LNKEYKAATDTEVDNFIELSGITTTTEIDKSKLTVMDRKRITAIVAEFQALDTHERERLNDYINGEIYSDELDKPFGVFSMMLEAFIGGYVKK